MVKGRGEEVVVELGVDVPGVVGRAVVEGVTARAVSFQNTSRNPLPSESIPSVEGVGGAVVDSRGLVTRGLRAVVLVISVWLASVSRYRRSRKIRLRERWPLTKPVNRRKTRITYGASMLRNHTIPP